MAMCLWSFTSSQTQHERNRKQMSMQNENKTTADLISLFLIVVDSCWPHRGTNIYGCTYIIKHNCIVTYRFN